MIMFLIVQEPYGRAVRRDDQTMMMPASCQSVAIEQAQRMVTALRGHGQQAQFRFAADLHLERVA